MKIIWANSSLSGLCDRFVDLFLMAALARTLKSDLVVLWKINRNFTDRQLKVWDKARFEDYKYENFSQYFNLPDCVKIIAEEDFSNYDLTDHVIFPDYLGGIYTSSSFYQRYMSKICDFETFDATHKQVLREFTPKQKLLDLIGEIPELDLAIHLRRGDKVNESPNNVEISKDSLCDLDDMTRAYVDKEISYLDKPNLFICSDEEKFLSEYELRYSDLGCNIFKLSRECTRVERTYVDLFLLSRSKTIVMSQKHSNFSLFASQINGASLVYFYANNPMIDDRNSIFHQST